MAVWIVIRYWFGPDQLNWLIPSLKGAKKYGYYLLQSPEDTVTPISYAREAAEALEKKGADVELVEYAGGHGWPPTVYRESRAGIEWLDARAD